MARPKAQIDWIEVGEMLTCGCDATSIAANIGVSTDTLYKRSKTDNKVDFSAYSQQKRARGSYLLRQKQFELAMNGNVALLIFLGKNRLGQTDKQEIKTRDLPATESEKDNQFLHSLHHARRIVEALELEPLGIAFDEENAEHLAALRKRLKETVEAQKVLYPESALSDWEERFERMRGSDGSFASVFS